MGATNIFRLFRAGHSAAHFFDAKGALAVLVTAAFDFHVIILRLPAASGRLLARSHFSKRAFAP